MIDTIRWVLIALAIPVVIWLVVITIRRARALSERIEEYHEEEEEAKKSGEPLNPYEAMSQVMGTRPQTEQKKRADRQ